jgi:hypothetical protein
MALDEAGVDMAGDEIGIGRGAREEGGVGANRPDLDLTQPRRQASFAAAAARLRACAISLAIIGS